MTTLAPYAYTITTGILAIAFLLILDRIERD